VQDLKFCKGLKQTLISQDLDFQKSKCRLKGRLHDLAKMGEAHTVGHHIPIFWSIILKKYTRVLLMITLLGKHHFSIEKRS
jgi:hypothetical protein